jgi:hypothetical protein
MKKQHDDVVNTLRQIQFYQERGQKLKFIPTDHGNSSEFIATRTKNKVRTTVFMNR